MQQRLGVNIQLDRQILALIALEDVNVPQQLTEIAVVGFFIATDVNPNIRYCKSSWSRHLEYLYCFCSSSLQFMTKVYKLSVSITRPRQIY